MIAEWSECKPRTGLNILNAFAKGSSISMNSIRELIGFLEVGDILPLLASLSGSMTFGLSYISEMKIDPSLVGLVVECLKVKSGASSYKLKLNDVTNVREQLANVSVEQLTKFLYGITKHNKLYKSDLINAYISAHSNFNDLVKPNTSDMLEVEKSQKSQIVSDTAIQKNTQAPTLSDLMRESDIITG